MKLREIPVLAVVALLLTVPQGSRAAAFDDVVAFGDSLSDTGNLAESPLRLAVDWEHYFPGRLSNGRVWVEYLADKLDLAGRLHNYAFAGAMTRDQVFLGGLFDLRLPGLPGQVSAYLDQHAPSPVTLFSVWIGAMNFFYGDAQEQAEAVADIRAALDRLAVAGARHILIGNLPDLGATPRWNAEEPTAAAGRQATLQFNAALDDTLAQFERAYPRVTLYVLDAFDIIARIQARPEAFGFANAVDANPAFGTDFANRGRYLFWDSIHPSTQGHALVAETAAALVRAPALRITANGVPHALGVASRTPVSIALRLSANYHAGEPVEIWLGAVTPAGWVSYVPPAGWVAGAHPCCRATLADLDAPTEIFSFGQGLPPGDYTFYVVLDDDPDDGRPNPAWWDTVRLQVE